MSWYLEKNMMLPNDTENSEMCTVFSGDFNTLNLKLRQLSATPEMKR